MADDGKHVTEIQDQTRGSHWGLGRYFIALFVPLALLVGGILGVIYTAERRIEGGRTRQQEQQDVATNQRSIITDLSAVVSDLTFLAGQSDLQVLLSGGSPDARDRLGRDYVVFCKTRKQYDRVRYIGLDGQEIVCVEYHGGKPDVVPWDQLATRVSDDFFKRVTGAKRGEVCASRLELSKKDGAIETPWKPLQRMGTPVFDAKGRKRGVLILDFLANSMLRKIRPERHILVSTNGHWLHGGRPEDRWGFMFNSDSTFARRHKLEWHRIGNDEDNQFQNERGLFTSATISPVRDAERLLKVHISGADNSVEGAPWKVVSYIPTARLHARSRRLRAQLLWFFAVVLVVLGVVSFHYARLMMRRREMQEKLREYALTDALTKVYNRRFGLQLLDRLIKECKRLREPLCVFMIDVNNLKPVNDNQGHPAGDDMIRTIAHVLRQTVREVDVVSRFGGDEFFVVLPFTALKDGRRSMERAQEALAAQDLSRFQGVDVSFSYGGAEYDFKDDPPISQLVDEADHAMYEYKRQYKIVRGLPTDGTRG